MPRHPQQHHPDNACDKPCVDGPENCGSCGNNPANSITILTTDEQVALHNAVAVMDRYVAHLPDSSDIKQTVRAAEHVCARHGFAHKGSIVSLKPAASVGGKPRTMVLLSAEHVQALSAWADEAGCPDGTTAWGPLFTAAMEAAKWVRDIAPTAHRSWPIALGQRIDAAERLLRRISESRVAVIEGWIDDYFRQPWATAKKTETIDALRAALKQGKYTRWASEFSVEQLVGLVWLVGEFNARARPDDYNPSEGVGGERRKIGALRCLAKLKREPMTVDDWRKQLLGVKRGIAPANSEGLVAPADVASGPITPADVASTAAASIPPEVFQAFNQLIVEKAAGNSDIRVMQEDVLIRACARGLDRDEIFRRGWLNIEAAYAAAGWEVEYDKPGYNEAYDAFFVFRRKD